MAEGQGRVLPHGTHGGKWPRAGTSHWQATLFVSYAAQPIARTVYNISLSLSLLLFSCVFAVDAQNASRPLEIE